MERAEVILEQPYSLGETLRSGQSFRWRQANGTFEGFVGNRPVRLRTQPGRIEIEWAGDGDPAAAVGRYLRMGDPMDAIYRNWAGDARLEQAAGRWKGLHLLSQDPFETTVSFIASSASNIPKISRSIEKMAARFGNPVKMGRREVYAFPTAKALARADTAGLRKCELGYRARYVKAAAQAVAEGEVDLAEVSRMETSEAQRALVEGLPGVGPKVAACALLFSMGKDDAFPVDRWIQRCVSEWYLGGRKVTAKRCEEWGRTKFGKHAGYAQQYLFHEVRAAAAGARAAAKSRR